MGTRLTSLPLALPLLLVLLQTSAASKCGCEGFFCVSETEFQLCSNGETVGEPVPCVTGIPCRNDTDKQCSLQLLCQEDNACTFEGVFPDTTATNKYYSCLYDMNTLELVKTVHTCSEGMYFAPEKGECETLEQIAADVGGASPGEPIDPSLVSAGFVGDRCPGQGNFPDPENSQMFYLCNGVGVGTRMPCPDGTTFDENSSNCVGTVKPMCRDPPGSTTPETDRDEFICPGSGYFPDPDNCRRYYQCDEDRNAFRRRCPKNTYFHQEINDCAMSLPERCQDLQTSTQRTDDETDDFTTDTTDQTTEEYTTDSVTTDTTETTEDFTTETDDSTDSNDFTTTESTQTDPTTTTAPSENDGFLCPGQGFYPDPRNCRNYYVCYDNMTPIRAECPEGTYYDTEALFCTTDLPERCRVTGNPPENTTPNTDATEDETQRPTTTATETTASQTVTQTPRDEDETNRPTTSPGVEFTCPRDGIFADPWDCQRYFVCHGSNGFYVLLPAVCPENTYFHEATQFCTKDIPERCNLSVTTTDSPETTSPTPTDDEGFECPGEGYYPHPRDCQRYYVCYGEGPAVPVICPNGTYFDDETEFCATDMPERCRTSEGNPSTTPAYTEEPPKGDAGFTCPGEGYFPDPESCRNYYICFSWTPVIRALCPNDTFFNEQNGFCEREMPERCRTTEPPQEDHTTSNDWTSSSTPSPQQEFRCSGDGYYADPADCQHYYICYNGNEIPVACPNGTYYDEETTLCVREVPRRCRGETTTERDEPRPTTVPPTSDDGDFTCTRQGYFPDPRNCQRYFVCYGFDAPVPINCPEGTYYDDKTFFCSSKIPDRCLRNETNNPPAPPQEGGFRCPHEGKFADPRDCQKYWVCFDRNMGYPVRCPNGTYYHEDSPFCLEAVPKRCRSEEAFRCPGRGYYPDPSDCQSYHICTSSGFDIPVRCPRNTYYDEISRSCTRNVPSRCNTSQESRFPCPGVGYYPDPRDCSRYYVCDVRGNAVSIRCPNNQYFNEERRGCSAIMPERCRTPENGQGFVCTGTGYFADPNDCRKYHVCGLSGREYTATCPPNTNYYDRIRTCLPGLPRRCKLASCDASSTDLSFPAFDFKCPGRGIFPDPDDCHRFYVCYGVARQVTCRGGMYYNEVTQLCGWERPERCYNGVPRPPPVAQEPQQFTCPGTGIFPDPNNCRMFYVCYGAPRHVMCDGGRYFDERTQRCGYEIPERCRGDGGNGVTQPPPTQAPSQFVCPGYGRFPDPNDCRMFYVCNGYPKHVLCGGGRYFDERTRRCSYEIPERCRFNGGNGGTQPPGIQEPTQFVCPGYGIFPDPNNCRMFYVCNGYPRHVMCDGGRYFNEQTRQCGYEIPERCRNSFPLYPSPPTEFVCPGYGRFPDPNDCRMFYVCNGYPKHVMCGGGRYFNERTRQCSYEIPERCRFNGGNGGVQPPIDEPSQFTCPGYGIFPDPNNCRMFYVCYGYPKHVMCDGGRYFNERTQRCGYEIPERCRINGGDNVPQPPAIEEQPQFVCPGNGIFPDPYNCRMFYVCYGYPKHVMCDGGRYFNERTRRCGYEVPERCGGYNNDRDTMQRPGVQPPALVDFVCPGTGLFPDPKNCRMFFVCFGYPRHVLCDGGKYFNDRTQQCDYEIPERCRGNEVTEPPTTQPPPASGEFVCPGTGLFPDPVNCRMFYVCYGYPRHVLCDGGKYFNERMQQCDYEIPERCRGDGGNGVTQPPPPPSQFVCPGYGRYPDPNDCRMFYICNGYPKHVFCDGGKYFNEMTGYCQREVPERCRDRVTDAPTTEVPTTTSPSTTPSYSFECTKPGKYPDPTDCHRYYSCNWKLEPTHLTCKGSHYFNDLTSKCQSKIPSRCRKELVSTPFECPGRGYYPSEESCRDYYYCISEQLRPLRFTCRPNEYFSEEARRCRPVITGYECDREELDSDETDDSDDSDEITETEDFTCTRPGLFPDYEDCKKFHVCTASLQHFHKTCNGNTYFNEVLHHCSFITTPRCRRIRFF